MSAVIGHDQNSAEGAGFARFDKGDQLAQRVNERRASSDRFQDSSVILKQRQVDPRFRSSPYHDGPRQTGEWSYGRNFAGRTPVWQRASFVK